MQYGPHGLLARRTPPQTAQDAQSCFHDRLHAQPAAYLSSYSRTSELIYQSLIYLVLDSDLF